MFPMTNPRFHGDVYITLAVAPGSLIFPMTCPKESTVHSSFVLTFWRPAVWHDVSQCHYRGLHRLSNFTMPSGFGRVAASLHAMP